MSRSRRSTWAQGSSRISLITAVQEGFDPPALQEMGALWSALVRQLGG